MEELKTIKFEVGQIETNLDDVETAVKASLKKYHGLAIQESDLADARKSRSELNSLASNINSWRLEKEREFMAPFLPKKEQCNRIVKLIKDTSNEIDTQVKDYEAQADAVKKQRITEWWNLNGNKQIPVEKVWGKRYLNKTYKDSDWQSDMESKHQHISAELAGFARMIDPAYPDATDWLIQHYMDSLDYGETLAAWEHEKDARQRAEYLKKEMASEKAKNEPFLTTEKKNEELHVETEKVQPETRQVSNTVNEATYWAEFRIEGATKQQMIDLNNAISNIGLAMHVLRDSNGNLRKGH